MTRREKEIEIAAECARIDTAIKLSHYTDSIDHIDDIKDKNLSYDEIAENAFIQGVKWADNNPKSPWISVKDDLPCNHEELINSVGCAKQTKNVVCFKTKRGVCSDNMFYHELKNKWLWSGDTPTYWCYIPEPPKE